MENAPAKEELGVEGLVGVVGVVVGFVREELISTMKMHQTKGE